MATRWTLSDETSVRHFMEWIGQQRLAGKRPVVEIVPERRSIDQNSISHAWYAEASKALQDLSPLEVKCESKLHVAVPMLRAEDEKFREFYDKAIRMNLSYEEKLKAMAFVPCTSLMSKDQLSRYLENLQQYWRGRGVFLEFPEDAARQSYPEAAR